MIFCFEPMFELIKGQAGFEFIRSMVKNKTIKMPVQVKLFLKLVFAAMSFHLTHVNILKA